MYASYFGLKHEPFSIAPDPRYLFMSERHREALAHLLYGVKGRGGGFVLLTGEIGAGKTTVCRCLLEQIPKRCNVAYIFNPKLSALELLKTVCDEFSVRYTHEGAGTPTVKDYLDPFNEFLLKTHSMGWNNVLIIDEAQNLSADVLEQLRLLTNLETNERKLLQIVLIGQPELRAMLQRPELEQLAQRVVARYHLDALTEAETVQYLRHRLAVAGLTSALPFNTAAMRRIHALARGVPRRINLLADRAMLGAYAESAPRVDRRIVDKAAGEVFGIERRMSLLRKAWPWALGGAVGAALAGIVAVVAVDAGREPAGAAAPKATAATEKAAMSPSAASAVSGSVPVAEASATATAAAATLAQGAPVFLTAAELSARQPALLNEADAWRELAPLWGIALPEGTADPCAAAPRAQWHCFKSAAGGLTLIRQLDRPGFITLRDDAGRAVHALLVGLDRRRATLSLGANQPPLQVSLVSLANLWQGDFATYWRVPDGYNGVITEGMSGTAVDVLGAQLAVARGESAPSGPLTFDAAMRSRVQAFQLAHGLRADGIAGPTTFMQLARASSAPSREPRLLAGPSSQ